MDITPDSPLEPLLRYGQSAGLGFLPSELVHAAVDLAEGVA